MKYNPCGVLTGPVNHSSPIPAIRIPKFSPLRHIAVTTVPCSIVRAASIIALPVAIAIFKKNWSVSAKNWITSVRCSFSTSSNDAITGDSSFKNASEAAILRWWNSSPIAIALAINTLTFKPSSNVFNALLNTGPNTSFIQCKRLMTCSL